MTSYDFGTRQMDYLYTAHDFVSEFLKLEFKGFLAKIMDKHALF